MLFPRLSLLPCMLHTAGSATGPTRPRLFGSSRLQAPAAVHQTPLPRAEDGAKTLAGVLVDPTGVPVGLTGATVSGELKVPGLTDNLYDGTTGAGLGVVPTGVGNSPPGNPDNVAVLDTWIEFAYADANVGINTNLQTGGVITASVNTAFGWSDFAITLTSPAFSAATGSTVLVDTVLLQALLQ